jgi:hypothetical protein
MTLPCRWAEGGLTGFAGRARFTRRFGYPGRIDDFERVWLTVAGVDSSGELSLNGSAVGRLGASDPAFEAEITPLLRPRNELVVDVEGDEQGGLYGEVVLEVRCQAFLRNIRVAFANGALQIEGIVAGCADRPLELYAVLGRRNVAYSTVTPSPAGSSFHMSGEIPSLDADDGPPVFKLDLVNGASVWYTFEQVCALPVRERPQS